MLQAKRGNFGSISRQLRKSVENDYNADQRPLCCHHPLSMPDQLTQTEAPDESSSRRWRGEELLTLLVDSLRRQYPGAVAGVLMYGSCLRSGELYDGLVDLYLVVDDYGIYRSPLLALANRLLCPNVFYRELEKDGKTLRCKYAVISRRDLGRASSRRFESYFWGRFTQPMAVVYSRDAGAAAFLEECLQAARDRFISSALPATAPEGSLDDFWTAALALSYRTELRAEGPDRARELVNFHRGFYLEATRRWRQHHSGVMVLSHSDGGWCYRAEFSPGRRRLAQITWGLRVPWGKFLSLCRLAKGLVTFDGGMDYIAWKLERHSGQTVDIPDKVRRRPLLHVWGLAWRLYRRGVFR